METDSKSGRLYVDIREAGYDAKTPVIRNIAFDVQAGELVGLIGPNGAGKSTTIKTILGLIKHLEGQVALGASGRYAYVPEQPVMYESFTLWEHLRLAASAFGIDEQTFTSRADSLLDKFRLAKVKHELPVTFSKGMQQKLMLIIGFILEPDIYIVDEPFIGLDPRATKDLLDLLAVERQRGAGILMSTHVLDTAERICDRFILLDQGSVMAEGTLPMIREQAECPSDATLFDCFHALT
ncbi:ABC transporter ATP-binding protein [Paenibacillus tarimensis]|uniref:ABC transporter ATP-binding protein n=1 Tax=Paenibacillus tarimensis TaxID=416012 RepID=UPI001F2B17ED|nr:ABC transporter ATP-binding protein [Paenibacillus tarimensis]MCF2945962.1 ABC transporter ATP-binding protein [Paenibacillus tarimensis]